MSFFNLTSKLSIIITLILLFFFSCNKENSSKTTILQPLAARITDSNLVTFSIANTAAQHSTHSATVIDLINKSSITSTGLNARSNVLALSNKVILDSLAIPNTINPSYYIFNYVGGGFVIISADKRVQPILAYSDAGYFKHSGKLPSGVLNWLSTFHQNIQLVRNNKTLKADAGITAMWSELVPLNGNGIRSLNMDNRPPPPCQPTSNTTTVAPLLITQWGQGWPYNALCPNTANYATTGHAATGCVATAMAQVIYYWKSPNFYNYSLMHLDYTNNGNFSDYEQLAKLMRDAGYSVAMSYGTESGADASLVQSALRGFFKYSSATYGSYNSNTAINNLNNKQPVILDAFTGQGSFLWLTWATGDGHCWVCDGYTQYVYTTCPTYNRYTGDVITPASTTTALLLHMNWGWNDLFVEASNDQNGWFSQWSVILPGSKPGTSPYNFQYQQNMTYNIHP